MSPKNFFLLKKTKIFTQFEKDKKIGYTVLHDVLDPWDSDHMWDLEFAAKIFDPLGFDFYGSFFADDSAELDFENDVAWNVVRNVFWNVAWNVIWNVVWNVVWNVGWNVAWNVGWNVVQNVIWNVVWNAVWHVIWNVAYCILIDGAAEAEISAGASGRSRLHYSCHGAYKIVAMLLRIFLRRQKLSER
jgi:hypothetical protein